MVMLRFFLLFIPIQKAIKKRGWQGIIRMAGFWGNFMAKSRQIHIEFYLLFIHALCVMLNI
jgi:hypothetical protein